MNVRDKKVIIKIVSEMTLLQDILKNIDFDYFISNEVLKRAVAMTLINIGELAKLLSDGFKNQFPNIPIKEITATRNVAAHGYQTLRMDDIWETVNSDIPELLDVFKKIIK